MTSDFDAIIIGAGQAGPSLAGRLNDAGMAVALVERKLFGGTCVNVGCTPTKTYVASARAAHVARHAGEYGVIVEGEVRVDLARVKERAPEVCLLALRFTGDEKEIDVVHPGDGHKPEFSGWRWEPMQNLPQLIVPFKRPVYERVVKEFAKLGGG